MIDETFCNDLERESWIIFKTFHNYFHADFICRVLFLDLSIYSISDSESSIKTFRRLREVPGCCIIVKHSTTYLLNKFLSHVLSSQLSSWIMSWGLSDHLITFAHHSRCSFHLLVLSCSSMRLPLPQDKLITTHHDLVTKILSLNVSKILACSFTMKHSFKRTRCIWMTAACKTLPL